MDGCRPRLASCSCHRSLTRRGFLKGCGALLAGLPAGVARAREGTAPRKARVALVFLSREGSSWPHPRFDVRRREREVTDALEKGCDSVELVPVVVAKPDELAKASALAGTIDGYLVYVLTLSWELQGCIPGIAALGKPTLVADEFLGGSGSFLCGYSDLRRKGLEAAAVASTRLEDLVSVAACFGEIPRDGLTPASFARRCESVYRRTFAATGGSGCVEDRVPLAGTAACVERLKKSRFLIVGAGRPGAEQDFLGAKGIHVGFEELAAEFDKADRDEAGEWARRWTREAEKVVDAQPDWVEKAAKVHLAMRALLERHGSDSITVNCLGGFAAGKLPAYPCLGFRQILDDGGQGVCEAMPDDTVSMLLARILTGRPGFVSDPVLDTSKDQIVYAHCVATTRAFGPRGEPNPFRIRTLHDLDLRGTCIQSFLPAGFMTTSFRTNVAARKMVVHRAKAVGNLDADRGCRTQLVGEVRGDIGKLFLEWDRFGWHRVTVYGDVQEPLAELGKALGLEVIAEA